MIVEVIYHIPFIVRIEYRAFGKAGEVFVYDYNVFVIAKCIECLIYIEFVV